MPERNRRRTRAHCCCLGDCCATPFRARTASCFGFVAPSLIPEAKSRAAIKPKYAMVVSRSSSLPASSFLRLILCVVLFCLHILCVQAYSCQTPLTFSENRLPAILEIENICTDNNVAMCLEFDGTVYLIQNMDPTTFYTVPTVLQDCWIFRASTCQGEILLEHDVTGTRKITIGCTKEWTDANAIGVANSTPLDCSLTVTPKLSDVFDGSMDFVPPDKKADVAEDGFEDLNTPMQFIDKDELLRGIYEMCFALALHGVDVTSATNIFRHVRAVIWHTQSCHPELIGSLIGFAQSYFGLYGAAFASLHASNLLAGTWIDIPDPLTTAQNASLQALIDHAVGVDVSMNLPDSALPTTLQGLPTNGNVSVRTVSRRAGSGTLSKFPSLSRSTTNSAAPTPTYSPNAMLSGEDICNSEGVGRWSFHKVSKTAVGNSTLDCCSPACFAFGKSARFITRPFTTTCCLSCNMGWCSDDLPARTRAVMQLGEVQVPTNSTTSLKPPVRVMI